MRGSLSFENPRKKFRASVLGLYGQNGSGKTALIDALELLKLALCGKQIPEKFADFINIDSDVATFNFEFTVMAGSETIPLSYQFSIQTVVDTDERNIDASFDPLNKKRVEIFAEILKCPIFGDSKPRMGTLFDTSSSELLLPRTRSQLLIGNNKKTEMDLLVAKKLAKVQSRSFIFSKEFLTVARKRVKDSQNLENFSLYIQRLENLVTFGNYELFVINTKNSAFISLESQPFSFKFSDETEYSIGTIMIPLNESTIISQGSIDATKSIIQPMNVVLEQLVPGLTIRIKDLGTQVLKNGELGGRIQLMSCKADKEIPLAYESEGIKKIISILQLLIVVYNEPSITVAIDELDTGVFEYLLGELLRLISERGKGQLIFTSHNLRPLETLDRGFIAFTTINPYNRYVRMTNVKETNNLRDFYYRDIMFGGQEEELYEPTRNAEIAFAFREAGESRGS